LIYGSSGTAALKRAAEKLRGFDLCTLEGASVDNLHSISLDEAVHMLKGGKIDLVVTNGNMMEKDYAIRRTAADINLPMILNGRLADRVLGAFSEKKLTYLELSEYLAGHE
jgi:carbamoyl-phosphate synthase large subunit